MKELIKRNNKGQFVKGNNSGHRFTKGEPSPRKGIKKPGWTNQTSFKKGVIPKNWKGDNVGYHALHRWVERHKGKPIKCSFCDNKEKVQWSNISFEYKRELSDWQELCYWCHRKYDLQNGWGLATIKYPEIGRKTI